MILSKTKTRESAVVILFLFSLTLLLLFSSHAPSSICPDLLGNGSCRFVMAENRPRNVSAIASDTQAHDFEKSCGRANARESAQVECPTSFIDQRRPCRCAVQNNSCTARERRVPNAEDPPDSSSRSRPCGDGIDLMFDETTTTAV